MKCISLSRILRWLPILIFVILLANVSPVAASDAPSLSFFNGGDDRNNAVSHIDTMNPYDSVIFNEAKELLESLKSSPSCHRIAATRLLKSCHVLDGKEAQSRGEYEALDRTRSVYAARLAICELNGAGAEFPSACLPLTIPPPQHRARFLFGSRPKLQDPELDDYPKEMLEPCLKSLESRAQWWTSYSNNRQDAMTICQVARMETQKDELINLHQSIVDSSTKLNRGLKDALHDTAMDSVRNKEFLEAVRELQRVLRMEMEETGLMFHDTHAKRLNEVESGLETLMEELTSTFSNLRNEAASDLEKAIENISAQINTLQQTLKASHDAEMLRSNEALQVHEESTLTIQELFIKFHLAMNSILDTDLKLMSERVSSLYSSLDWLTSRFTQILEQGNELAYKLKTMEESVELSTNQSIALQEAQYEQAKALDAQVKALGELKFAAKLCKGLMEKTATVAANLQVTLDEATAKAKRIPTSLESLSTWALNLLIWAAISVCFLFLTIAALLYFLGMQRLVWQAATSVTSLILGSTGTFLYMRYL